MDYVRKQQDQVISVVHLDLGTYRMPANLHSTDRLSSHDLWFVIHGLDHLYAAIDIAHDTGCTVNVISAYGAAGWTGIAFWLELIRAGRTYEKSRARTELLTKDILDCTNYPGYALAAIRLGQTHIIYPKKNINSSTIRNRAIIRGICVHDHRPLAWDFMNVRQHRMIEDMMKLMLAHAPCR